MYKRLQNQRVYTPERSKASETNKQKQKHKKEKLDYSYLYKLHSLAFGTFRRLPSVLLHAHAHVATFRVTRRREQKESEREREKKKERVKKNGKDMEVERERESQGREERIERKNGISRMQINVLTAGACQWYIYICRCGGAAHS